MLLVIDGNVTTPIDTHNARVEVSLWDKNESVKLDYDVFYLGNTTANQSKDFRFCIAMNQSYGKMVRLNSCF